LPSFSPTKETTKEVVENAHNKGQYESYTNYERSITEYSWAESLVLIFSVKIFRVLVGNRILRFVKPSLLPWRWLWASCILFIHMINLQPTFVPPPLLPQGSEHCPGYLFGASFLVSVLL
jgi:hypothetical protein